MKKNKYDLITFAYLLLIKYTSIMIQIKSLYCLIRRNQEMTIIKFYVFNNKYK